MSDLPLLRIVVNTNVLFEGLTKQGGAQYTGTQPKDPEMFERENPSERPGDCESDRDTEK